MKITRKLSAALLAALCAAAAPAHADWLISSYTTGTPQITNYSTADALIGGYSVAAGFPVTANYALADTWDNNGNAGGFAPGVQLSGLPAGDNDDFAFVGTGQLTVGTTGNYTFRTNTDDGSRVKISINGGAYSQIITDDVLSGPHDVNSAPIALTAGDNVAFDWMWFERGGGAEGEFSYNFNGGAQALIGNNSQGLTLVGGSLVGKTYKAVVSPQTAISSLAVAQSIVVPANFKGSALRPTVNTNNDAGNAGHFPGDLGTPGIGPGGENMVVNSTGLLRVTSANTYRFGVLSDDGSQLKIDGVGVIVDDSFHGAGDPGDIKLSAPVFLTVGYHPIEALWFEAGGGASGEFFVVDIVTGAPIALLGDFANGGLEVTQTVPEPSSLLLVGSALAALCFWRRRRV